MIVFLKAKYFLHHLRSFTVAKVNLIRIYLSYSYHWNKGRYRIPAAILPLYPSSSSLDNIYETFAKKMSRALLATSRFSASQNSGRSPLTFGCMPLSNEACISSILLLNNIGAACLKISLHFTLHSKINTTISRSKSANNMVKAHRSRVHPEVRSVSPF